MATFLLNFNCEKDDSRARVGGGIGRRVECLKRQCLPEIDDFRRLKCKDLPRIHACDASKHSVFWTIAKVDGFFVRGWRTFMKSVLRNPCKVCRKRRTTKQPDLGNIVLRGSGGQN